MSFRRDPKKSQGYYTLGFKFFNLEIYQKLTSNSPIFHPN